MAELAQAGVPSSSIIRFAGEEFSVADLLNDSTATFDLKEDEIAWTAIALALYLPPQQQWQTRDGRIYTFDDLASELMRRPLSSESCGGAHILEALTFVLRADQDQRILSPQVRMRVHGSLKAYVDAACRTQWDDGSWALGWEKGRNGGAGVETKLQYRILVTGHMAEWLEYVPEDLAVPEAVLRKATSWLSDNLSTMPVSAFVGQEFCPWTHSVCAIGNLVEKP